MIRALSVGNTGYMNEAMPWIVEYQSFKRLKEMGIITNAQDIDAYTTEVMLHIDIAIDKAKAEAEKARKK